MQIGELRILCKTDNAASDRLREPFLVCASHVLPYSGLARKEVCGRRLIQNAHAAVALMLLKFAALENPDLHGAKVIRAHMVVGHAGILRRVGTVADSLKTGCCLKARHWRELGKRGRAHT